MKLLMITSSRPGIFVVSMFGCEADNAAAGDPSHLPLPHSRIGSPGIGMALPPD